MAQVMSGCGGFLTNYTR